MNLCSISDNISEQTGLPGVASSTRTPDADTLDAKEATAADVANVEKVSETAVEIIPTGPLLDKDNTSNNEPTTESTQGEKILFDPLLLDRSSDLITQNFGGVCKFGMIFPGRENRRTPRVHVSNVMNKVFLKVETTFVVKFTLDPTKAPSTDLYVRATLKFCSIDNVQFPVDRCRLHMLEDDSQNKSHEFEHLCKCTYFNFAGHVLRSPSPGAIYCYDPLTRRHSVLNPLKSRSHDIIYSFHCKSSCSKGIDRRPLQVVFTLEQLNGAILGQTSMNVKICTSPKRDRDRNEAEFATKTVKRRRVYYETTEALDSESADSPGCSVDMKRPATSRVETYARIRNHIQSIRQHLQAAETLTNNITQLAQYGLVPP